MTRFANINHVHISYTPYSIAILDIHQYLLHAANNQFILQVLKDFYEFLCMSSTSCNATKVKVRIIASPS